MYCCASDRTWHKLWIQKRCSMSHPNPNPHPNLYSRSNLYIKGILITMACYSMTPVYIAYVWLFLNRKSWHLPIPVSSLTACVRLQNLPWYKTGLVSRQVLYLLSKLQNWILSKTGQYKTCLVSNTKIEASIRATKPKPWQSHLTSETVEIFIQNEKAGFWCGRLSVGTKPALVQQV